MLKKEDCYRLGTVIKTHGIKGELLVKLNNLSFPEDIIRMELVFLEVEGLLVPFFIEDIHSVSSQSCIMKFEKLDSEEKAVEFTGCNVYSDIIKPENPDATATPEQFTGYSIKDTETGFSGEISEVLDVADNPLFRVVSEGREQLIPAQQEFIIRIDTKKKIIFVQLPEGLLDINN